MAITLWDIPSTVGPWSPNTWKIRYCLNLKKLPYKTEWVEFPDIATHCVKLGIPATGTNPDGTPAYTLPAIYDSSTGVYLADSTRIAEYLDKLYPDSPRIFPSDTKALQINFEDQLEPKLAASRDFVVAGLGAIMTPASQEYWRTTREKAWGKRLEDIAPIGDAYVEQWAEVYVGFAAIEAWYSKHSNQGPFMLGKQPCWADFVVGGHLAMFKAAWSDDDPKWKAVTSWNDGVWKSLRDALEVYGTVN